MRDYMDRPVTSPTWGSPAPRKQALKDPTMQRQRERQKTIGTGQGWHLVWDL